MPLKKIKVQQDKDRKRNEILEHSSNSLELTEDKLLLLKNSSLKNWENIIYNLNSEGIIYSIDPYHEYIISCEYFRIIYLEENFGRLGDISRTTIYPGFQHSPIYCDWPGNKYAYYILSTKDRISKVKISFDSPHDELWKKFVKFIDKGKNYHEYELYSRVKIIRLGNKGFFRRLIK
ncbi:MAG: hypothetical protein IT553_08875 [Sphingomonadaceae bacterium]|nr:hypothetical protein [Sphingomonadaceae bacterium]